MGWVTHSLPAHREHCFGLRLNWLFKQISRILGTKTLSLRLASTGAYARPRHSCLGCSAPNLGCSPRGLDVLGRDRGRRRNIWEGSHRAPIGHTNPRRYPDTHVSEMLNCHHRITIDGEMTSDMNCFKAYFLLY